MKKHTTNSNKMNCLFVILNPYQYYNALEFIEQHQSIINSKILLLSEPKQGMVNEINKIFQFDNWDKVYNFDYSKYKSPTTLKARNSLFKVANVLVKEHNIDNLVLGHFGIDLCYALAHKHKKRMKSIWALDDGIPTLKIMESRHLNNDYKSLHKQSLKETIKTFLKFNMLLFSKKPLKKVKFFTIYNEKAGFNDEITINTSRKLKNFISVKNINPKLVFFVGSVYIKKGSISKKNYISLIKQFKNFMNEQDKQVIYIPHRYETDEELALIQEIMPIKKSKLAIELMLGQLDELPAEITGFYSSVFFVINKILPKEVNITAIKIDIPFISKDANEGIDYIRNVYTKIENTEGLKTIEYNFKIN